MVSTIRKEARKKSSKNNSENCLLFKGGVGALSLRLERMPEESTLTDQVR